VAASCRTGRKGRTQLNDASLSGGPIAKTGAAFGSVMKALRACHTASTTLSLPVSFIATRCQRAAARHLMLWLDRSSGPLWPLWCFVASPGPS
jgi:hypothetical protein